MPRTTHTLAAALLTGATLFAAPAVAQFEDQGVTSFLTADRNGDEVLTLPEFRTFIRTMAEAGAPQSQMIRRFAAYRIAFGRVDGNGDGFATPEELRAAEARD